MLAETRRKDAALYRRSWFEYFAAGKRDERPKVVFGNSDSIR